MGVVRLVSDLPLRFFPHSLTHCSEISLLHGKPTAFQEVERKTPQLEGFLQLWGEGQRAQPSGTQEAECLGRRTGSRRRGLTRAPVRGHSPATVDVQHSDSSDSSDSNDGSSGGHAVEAALAILGAPPGVGRWARESLLLARRASARRHGRTAT